MSVTFDFTIVPSRVDGISSVMPMNEDAYNWMVAEAHLAPLPDGSTVLFDELVGDFVSDAGYAHMVCDLV